MRDGLRDKRTSTYGAINCSTVEIVDDTPPVINPEGRYWSKIAIFVPFRGSPLKYFHKVWCGETRMMSLPDSEKILKILLLILNFDTTYERDRQQDGRMSGTNVFGSAFLSKDTCANV